MMKSLPVGIPAHKNFRRFLTDEGRPGSDSGDSSLPCFPSILREDIFLLRLAPHLCPAHRDGDP